MKSYALLFAFTASPLFFSCALSPPDVRSVRAASVFEYTDDVSYPRMRLAVFTEATSDVRRVESIRIVSNEAGWEWKAVGVDIFESDAKMWAG